MEVRSKRNSKERELMMMKSPDRAKVCVQPKVKPIKKVQVVYYLSRNGQLEHPHYMEVTHFAHHHLRLKDVMDRLTVLRGKGIPSLYSWSCKRSYKNGYVWNDLTENDVIYPSDGAEYVLKGSELVEGCSEKFQQLHVGNNNSRQLIQEPNLPAKAKQLGPTRNTKFEYEDFEEEEEDLESQEEYEDEEKTSYTSSTTPHSRCSRGVSTDELEEPPTKNLTSTESTHHRSSSLPPPTPQPPPSSNKPQLISNSNNRNNASSQRFEDGDPISTESITSRNSVLLQLISCGNLAVAKAKNNAGSATATATPSNVKQPPLKVSNGVNVLHKGALYRNAVKAAEEDVMIRYMSENPRFGNLQAEEKEYFSGSIVESMSENRDVGESAGLKRSNSYNEERGTKGRLEDEEEVQEEIKERGAKGKCIPRKMGLSSSSSSKQTKK
ncbi:protein SOSEKI 2 [Mercurialis annua]|uniref:protein SOSEKI 2 n=1 Tax=Mercurialis annua TaxID=3986 RepID=UPI00215F615B|nr:protein SOSEKI 2 [Mercurialis annua]